MIKVQNHLDRFQSLITNAFFYILRIVLSAGLGFLTAQCTLFENFSPFSLILLSTSGRIGLVPTFCYLGSAIGYLFASFNLSTFKYITALTMVYVIYMVFQKSLKMVQQDTAILTACCCFTSGFLFLLVGQLTLYNVLILVGESLLICCCIYFINYASNAFRRNCFLTAKEIIAAIITLILILIALHNTYVFNLSVARIFALSIFFLALPCLKTSHTAVLGSCLGIILSAVSDGGEAIFTATTVGSLAACVFSNFSNQFAYTSFLLIYYAALIFFGRFPWNYWYFAEPLLAYALTFAIPKDKLRSFLSAYIPVRGSNGKKDKKANNKVLQYCQKECEKLCPKAEICYSKNEPELLETIEMLRNGFNQHGTIGNIETAIPFCIKPKAMKSTLEKQFEQNTGESLDDLTEQLDYLTRRMELRMNSALKIIHFLADEEKELEKVLSERKIHVKDICFIVDEFNCRRCNITFSVQEDILFKKIIKECIRPYFERGFSIQIKRQNGNYVANIKECSAYSLSCAAICKTKDGEKICGDQAIGFSIGKERYYLLLADGMGSGLEAGLQSELIVQSLRKLIIGGLSIENALNIYQAIARFRQDGLFSTIDICSIDLENGSAELFKAGAFDSFIIKNNQIIIYSGGGVPLGLTEKDRLQQNTFKFEDGDFLIMATDGLSAIKEVELLLNQCKSEDPRTFARNILQTITQESNDSGNDDITVMVCKFNKTTV